MSEIASGSTSAPSPLRDLLRWPQDPGLSELFLGVYEGARSLPSSTRECVIAKKVWRLRTIVFLL
jgi:hypothetical protein